MIVTTKELSTGTIVLLSISVVLSLLFCISIIQSGFMFVRSFKESRERSKTRAVTANSHYKHF
jgi:hypothetical protein